MRERHRAQPALVGVEPERHRRAERVGQPVAVRQLDGLGRGGRPGGVHDGRDHVGSPCGGVRALDRRRRERFVDAPCRRAGSSALLPLGLAQPQVDRHRRRARQQAGVQRDRELARSRAAARRDRPPGRRVRARPPRASAALDSSAVGEAALGRSRSRRRSGCLAAAAEVQDSTTETVVSARVSIDWQAAARVRGHPLRARDRRGRRDREDHDQPARGPQRVPSRDRGRADRRVRARPRGPRRRRDHPDRRGPGRVLLGRRPARARLARRLRERRRPVGRRAGTRRSGGSTSPICTSRSAGCRSRWWRWSPATRSAAATCCTSSAT